VTPVLSPYKANRVDQWQFDAAATFLGLIHAALGFIRLRKSTIVNTA
jgi:hypothetical protein